MSSERCGIIPVMQPETKVTQFVSYTRNSKPGAKFLWWATCINIKNNFPSTYIHKNWRCTYKTSVSNVTSERIQQVSIYCYFLGHNEHQYFRDKFYGGGRTNKKYFIHTSSSNSQTCAQQNCNTV